MRLDRYIFLIIVFFSCSCDKRAKKENSEEISLVSISKGPLNPRSFEIEKYKLIVSGEYDVENGSFFYEEPRSYILSKRDFDKIINGLFDSGLMDITNVKKESDIGEDWYCIDIEFKDKTIKRFERVTFLKQFQIIDSLLYFESGSSQLIKDYDFRTFSCAVIHVPSKLDSSSEIK